MVLLETTNPKPHKKEQTAFLSGYDTVENIVRRPFRDDRIIRLRRSPGWQLILTGNTLRVTSDDRITACSLLPDEGVLIKYIRLITSGKIAATYRAEKWAEQLPVPLFVGM